MFANPGAHKHRFALNGRGKGLLGVDRPLVRVVQGGGGSVAVPLLRPWERKDEKPSKPKGGLRARAQAVRLLAQGGWAPAHTGQQARRSPRRVRSRPATQGVKMSARSWGGSTNVS